MGMKILLTGANGFVGGRVSKFLLDRGHQVRQLRRQPPVDELPAGVETVIGDLTNGQTLPAAVEGVEAVIHCAGLTGMWGDLSTYLETNTMGTVRLLETARREKVKYFVYTSTPSVVHSGLDLAGVDETASYSLDSTQPYAYSKMLAERMVLWANGPDFKTLALRPHLIWGPGDPHLLPRLAQRAVRGRLFLFTKGPYLVDATYIDNAAIAHVQALEKLASGAPADGQAFFIAQGQPMDINQLVNRLLAAVGAPMVPARIPKWLGLSLAGSIERFWRFFKLSSEPPVTIFTARQMSSSHWYNLGKAQRILGYRPLVSLEDGLRRVAESRIGQKPQDW
ncbi:MAG: NAD-dependent epimerase/dehydratase family protein [Deltaproteobacteria bacterium]|jgi:nucleoside-diphosphate-sugar epimerase|nr:NAD-dependent epimerase/dehydratase family protein [Deltaproteobacteria bacterium]